MADTEIEARKLLESRREETQRRARETRERRMNKKIESGLSKREAADIVYRSQANRQLRQSEEDIRLAHFDASDPHPYYEDWLRDKEKRDEDAGPGNLGGGGSSHARIVVRDGKGDITRVERPGDQYRGMSRGGPVKTQTGTTKGSLKEKSRLSGKFQIR